MNNASEGDSQACEPCPTASCEPCTPVCTVPQADIESLHAVNVPCTRELEIGYKLDTKKTCDDMDLLVRVEHCGNVLFERLIHLGRPYRTDYDGDRHFHGSVYGQLPEPVCANRDKLRVLGWVVPHNAAGDTAMALDTENEHVHGADGTAFAAYVPKGWPEARTH
jgi:hypothetical protein